MTQLEVYSRALDRAGQTPFTVGRDRAGVIWGVSRDVAKQVLKKLRAGRTAESMSGSANTGKLISKAETVTETKDSLQYEVPNTRIKSLEELIEAFRIDTTIWECERFIANKWECAAKLPDGSMVVEPLYQIKATFIKKKSDAVEFAKSEISRLIDEAKKDIKSFNVNRVSKLGSGCNMLEISIPDTHIGGMSWRDETGQANYDHKIASRLHKEAFYDLLGRGASSNSLSEVLIVLGNDFMNVDGENLTTTRGTVVDQDSRYAKMFQAAWNVAHSVITDAVQVAPVRVIVCPGNHDRTSTWTMAHSLESFFHSARHITIDNSPRLRKYLRYGVNMLMFAHGDTVKPKDIPLLMATEEPGMFGSTKFREAHLGHTHQEKLTESNGVKVRVIPSLCPANAWAVSNGYSGNMRGAQAFTWNEQCGLIATTEHYIDLMAE